jgi:V/A-type H+-transporting ATPase subunit I
MPLRPDQARWFETYLPRNATVRGVEVLAKTGAVQLETERGAGQATPVDVGRLRYFVERFQQLAGAHAQDMPRIGGQPSSLEGDPIHLANQALHRLRTWCDRVDLAHARLDQLDAEIHHLRLLQECVEGMASEGLDLDRVFSKTRFLCKCLFACPKQETRFQVPRDGVEEVVHGNKWDFLYVAGLPERRHLIRQLAVEQGCEQIAIPAWLSGGLESQRQELKQRLADARRELAHRKVELRTLREDAQIAQDRADLDTLRWYLNHAADTLGEGPLNRVSGWTTAKPRQLRQALAEAGVQAIIRSPRPPAKAATPVTTAADWWARPFRPLVELMGPPGRQEVDPSGLLALVVPLLFGYMFPDLGHGLILALGALALSRRWPQVRFLIPCGVSAMAFGLLAGDVFGLHGLIPPLWVAPLDDPLLILTIPMGFGALLLLLGLALAGVQAHWRGETRQWLWKEGALAVLYVAVLAGLLYPAAFWLAGLAGLQFLVASLVQTPAGHRLSRLPGMIGDLLLGIFELGINTLSFLRVGAFALGHAALSQAVVTLAQTTDCIWGWWVVMVLGNLFALVLEGLLVLVQTTRLVLFEFFTRFLRGEGRAFQPVQQPPVAGRRRNGRQSRRNKHTAKP